MTKQTIIQTGAEAIISKKDNLVVKKRVSKGYRLPELDNKIRKLRTRSETKLLEKASKLIPTPRVIKSSDKEMEIDMEFINGKKLSEHLDSLPQAEQICIEIGKNLAKIHDEGIVHGDLTTSNMILAGSERSERLDKSDATAIASNFVGRAGGDAPQVYFIDYGLGFANAKTEDKAVDLHLIKQALEAKHFLHHEKFFAKILEGYKTSKHADLVLKQFKKVESRGRYKEQY